MSQVLISLDLSGCGRLAMQGFTDDARISFTTLVLQSCMSLEAHGLSCNKQSFPFAGYG
jgi:hypothetical protein